MLAAVDRPAMKILYVEDNLHDSDLTRRERDLRESDERLRQFAEKFKEAFWLTDPDKNEMLYISPAYEEIRGRT